MSLDFQYKKILKGESSLFTQNHVERFDDMLINLIGLRADILILPPPVIAEILQKAKLDLTFIIEGFKNAWKE